MASSAPGQASKPGPDGGAKTGGPTQTATITGRGSGRAAALAATKAGRLRAAQNATQDANIERIVRVVRGRLGAKHSRTVVRLDPPELGSLRLQMDLRGTALTLRIDTSTGLAHRLLSEDLPKLRDGLEGSGIQLERVEVRPPALTPEAGEYDASRHADQRDDARGESAQEDAEHPQERGRESYLAEAQEGTDRDKSPEPTTESSVNVIA
jgi:flagellar hook-length control protein FliK